MFKFIIALSSLIISLTYLSSMSNMNLQKKNALGFSLVRKEAHRVEFYRHYNGVVSIDFRLNKKGKFIKPCVVVIGRLLDESNCDVNISKDGILTVVKLNDESYNIGSYSIRYVK
jgi:hypothetical protein